MLQCNAYKPVKLVYVKVEENTFIVLILKCGYNNLSNSICQLVKYLTEEDSSKDEDYLKIIEVFTKQILEITLAINNEMKIYLDSLTHDLISALNEVFTSSTNFRYFLKIKI